MTLKTLAKALVPTSIKRLVRHSIENSRVQYGKWMSRHYYGNTLDYAVNREGERNWSASRRAFTGPVDRKLHSQFMKVGYVDLSEAVDMAVVKRFQQAYQLAITDPARSYNPFADPARLQAYNHGNYQGPLGEYRRTIKNPQQVFPHYSELFNDKITRLIQSYMGCDFSVAMLACYRNTHVPPHILKDFEPHASRWHFDHQIFDWINLFLYLSDVTPDHGPFQCFDRSYSHYLLKQGYTYEGRRISVTGGLPEQLFDTPRRKSFVGPVGTMFMCASSFCMHRAGEMGPGNLRDVYTVSLRPCLPGRQQAERCAAA